MSTQIIPGGGSTDFELSGLNSPGGGPTLVLPAIPVPVVIAPWGQIMPISGTPSGDATPNIVTGEIDINTTGVYLIHWDLTIDVTAVNPFIWEDYQVALFNNGLSTALVRQVTTHTIFNGMMISADFQVDPASGLGVAGDTFDIRLAHTGGFSAFLGAITVLVRDASFYVVRIG